MQHIFARTHPLPELADEREMLRHPIVRHQDKDLYFRQYGSAYGFGSYRHDPLPIAAEDLAHNDHPAILPYTPEHFAASLGDAYARIPALERAGRFLLRRTGMQAVLITRGSRGMALFERKQRTAHIPIFGSDEVTDVTGAGDTVIATFALALSAGASFYEAARLANYAGGLVVMKRGTATVSSSEVSDAVRSDHQESISYDSE